jgi:hypothetical protein
LQILKLSTFFLLFALTLISGVVAKASFLLMTAGIGNSGRNVSICADKIPGKFKDHNDCNNLLFRIRHEHHFYFAKTCGKVGMGYFVDVMRSGAFVFCAEFSQESLGHRKTELVEKAKFVYICFVEKK